jgi:hypothetical protein
MMGLPELISADEIVGRVLVAVRARGADLSVALDQLPAAIYVTDPNGVAGPQAVQGEQGTGYESSVV